LQKRTMVTKSPFNLVMLQKSPLLFNAQTS
jgi:hypothetical protein